MSGWLAWAWAVGGARALLDGPRRGRRVRGARAALWRPRRRGEFWASLFERRRASASRALARGGSAFAVAAALLTACAASDLRRGTCRLCFSLAAHTSAELLRCPLFRLALKPRSKLKPTSAHSRFHFGAEPETMALKKPAAHYTGTAAAAASAPHRRTARRARRRTRPSRPLMDRRARGSRSAPDPSPRGAGRAAATPAAPARGASPPSLLPRPRARPRRRPRPPRRGASTSSRTRARRAGTASAQLSEGFALELGEPRDALVRRRLALEPARARRVHEDRPRAAVAQL